MGVPEGSTLWPLLFYIFVNDLSDVDSVENDLIMYAGDKFYLCYETRMNKFLEKKQKMIKTSNYWF